MQDTLRCTRKILAKIKMIKKANIHSTDQDVLQLPPRKFYPYRVHVATNRGKQVLLISKNISYCLSALMELITIFQVKHCVGTRMLYSTDHLNLL